MSVSVRVNTFLSEDRCWSYFRWGCGAISLHPLQHLCLSLAAPSPVPGEQKEGEGAGVAQMAELYFLDSSSLCGPDFCSWVELLWARHSSFSNPLKAPAPAVLEE